MVSAALVEQIKCRWREFRREPSAFFWVIFMPLIWMIVLGIAFSNPKPESYGVGLKVDASASDSVPGRIEQLLASDTQVKLRLGSKTDLDKRFRRGEIVLEVARSSDGSVTYRFDQANPESLRAQRYVNDLIQTDAGRRDPVITKTSSIQSEGGRYIDFLIPGLLGLSIMTSSLFGVSMTIASNRRENLLKRYLATPMRKYEYLVSHVFGRLMVLTFEFSAIMIAGWLLFRFHVYGSFTAYLLVTVVGTAAFTSLALLVASRSKSLPFISGLTNIIALPMMMLSGVFFSKANFPDWLLPAINKLPLTALTDGLRKVSLEGLAVVDVIPELTILTAYFLVTMVITRFIFKWY